MPSSVLSFTGIYTAKDLRVLRYGPLSRILDTKRQYCSKKRKRLEQRIFPLVEAQGQLSRVDWIGETCGLRSTIQDLILGARETSDPPWVQYVCVAGYIAQLLALLQCSHHVASSTLPLLSKCTRL
eukprot:scpid8969/ scgid12010/ 